MKYHSLKLLTRKAKKMDYIKWEKRRREEKKLSEFRDIMRRHTCYLLTSWIKYDIVTGKNHSRFDLDFQILPGISFFQIFSNPIQDFKYSRLLG